MNAEISLIKVVSIPGGKGMLGTDLAKTLKEAGYRVKVFDYRKCDTKQRISKKWSDAGDFVMIVTAYTNVDKAESGSISSHAG
ncbi:MAG: sugar nucleotide-binding protein [Halofilum sp. (in: g-proteobacteria)]|nr:sugar nucleotide-binding protein [Halofilum sp. (in: g-proteobacteria)]